MEAVLVALWAGLLLAWIAITLRGAVIRDAGRDRAAKSGYLLLFGVVCAAAAGFTLAAAI